MAVPQLIQAFNAGEIAPELYGAVSLEKYASAATTMRNMVVAYRGGAMSRAGFALVGVSKQPVGGSSTGPPRPITFQFSNNQGYALEFGDGYLRFVFQGGYVLEAGVAITGASHANPCAISVSGTPYANGDWVFITGVVGMTELNGQTFIVANSVSGSFTLEDLNGNPIDSTGYGAYVSGGSVARIYTVASPYAAEDLPYLKISQTADVMSLTCSNPVTGNEYLPYDLTRLSATDWTLQPTSFDPVITAPTTVTAVSSGKAPAGGVDASFGYVVTAVDTNGNESVASVIANCNGADIDVEGATNVVTWSPVGGAVFYNVYRGPTQVYNTQTGYQPIPVGSVFGFIGSAYGNQFADSGVTRDLQQTPPVHQNPFDRGQILAVNVTGPGSNLTAVTYTISTATGSDFVGTPAVAGGQLGGFPITDPGKNYEAGDSITLNGAGFASGAIGWGSASDVAVGDTITLNGVVWTFVSAITGANQTVATGALSDTLDVLIAGLGASIDPGLVVATYSTDGKNLLITYNTAGVAGNSYTLAASADISPGPSGSTLTGGSGFGPAGTKASGDVTFGANPTNGQTIVLDGVTWTFVSSGASGDQTNIQGSLAATLTQLASDLNASSDPDISLANYAGTATDLDVTYKTVGAVGNTYTLGQGTAGSGVSGATLSGGTDASTTPTATLSIGPNSGTYPGVNAYFQQRHFFANSFNNPDTVWATQEGLYKNMDVSIPTISTDAITASPWSEQVNGIQWMVAMPGGLIVLTGLRAWQLIGEGSYQLNVQPITPSTVQAQPQAFNGCSATVPPVVIDYDVLYVQAIGQTTVYDLSWNFWVNIYTGNDLTILSSHLFLNRQIVQWAWARQPYKVLWACCDDGTMLSLTFLKEQQVYGWARHDTLGLVVGLCSVTEPPVDAIYAIVQRFPPYAPSGIYVMERMDDRLWQSVEDGYCVDSGVSNPLTSPAASLIASSTTGAVTFSASAAVFASGNVSDVVRMGGGIATISGYTDGQHLTGTWVLSPSIGAPGFAYAAQGNWTIASPVSALNAPHLAGMSVVGLADGVPIGPLTVGAEPLGTITLPFEASNVKVGLGFTCQLQTPYLNGPDVVQGARKMIPAATVRFAASGTGAQWGTNQPDGAAQNPPQLAPAWSNLATLDTTKPTGGQSPGAVTYLSPAGETVTQLWTGDLRAPGVGNGWVSKGQVAVQQTLPLALEILAVVPEMLPGDSPEAAIKARSAGRAPVSQAPQGQPPQGPGPWMIRGGYE